LTLISLANKSVLVDIIQLKHTLPVTSFGSGTFFYVFKIGLSLFCSHGCIYLIKKIKMENIVTI